MASLIPASKSVYSPPKKFSMSEVNLDNWSFMGFGNKLSYKSPATLATAIAGAVNPSTRSFNGSTTFSSNSITKGDSLIEVVTPSISTSTLSRPSLKLVSKVFTHAPQSAVSPSPTINSPIADSAGSMANSSAILSISLRFLPTISLSLPNCSGIAPDKSKTSSK